MDLPRGDDPRATRIVFVCYANHCRSPMMELLLRDALVRSGSTPLLVSSAGTHAQPGLAAHPYAVRALAEHGVDATGWGATRLSLELVEGADLILTAAAEQRRDVVAMAPAAANRTFTLLDFSAWLEAAPVAPGSDGAPDLLARAAAGRAAQPDGHPERDLPDPMGRGLRHFRVCRRRVEAAVAPFLDRG